MTYCCNISSRSSYACISTPNEAHRKCGGFMTRNYQIRMTDVAWFTCGVTQKNPLTTRRVQHLLRRNSLGKYQRTPGTVEKENGLYFVELSVTSMHYRRKHNWWLWFCSSQVDHKLACWFDIPCLSWFFRSVDRLISEDIQHFLEAESRQADHVRTCRTPSLLPSPNPATLSGKSLEPSKRDPPLSSLVPDSDRRLTVGENSTILEGVDDPLFVRQSFGPYPLVYTGSAGLRAGNVSSSLQEVRYVIVLTVNNSAFYI